jgi:hypothetical protein
MANVSSIKLPNNTTYIIKDKNALPLTGGAVTGPVSFGDTITVDDATFGQLVVSGSASVANNLQVNTINGVAVGNNPKFTDTLALTSMTGTLGVAHGGTGNTTQTANRLIYAESATKISSASNIAYFTGNSTATSPAKYHCLHIYGDTYGNTANQLISNTAGVFRYGDGGPQITFSTGADPTSSSQSGAIIFTDHDTSATGTSFHFVSNQNSDNNGGDCTVTVPRLRARKNLTVGQNSDNTSYILYANGASAINGILTINANNYIGVHRNDYKHANTASSSMWMNIICGYDADNIARVTIRQVAHSDDYQGVQVETNRTNGTNTWYNGIRLEINKTGTRRVVVSENAQWRAALAVPYMVDESYPALVPTNGSNNWIKIGTSNTSYGILPSQAGGAGSGHNYIGTSSWYWKYAYIDEINTQKINGVTVGSSPEFSDTTYSAGSGLTLSGTTFSLASATGETKHLASTSASVAKNTGTSIGSLSLGTGTWIVAANVSFPTGTGYRLMNVAQTAGSTWSVSRVPAVSGAATALNFTWYFKDTATVYLNVWHNHTANLTVTGEMYAVRIR